MVKFMEIGTKEGQLKTSDMFKVGQIWSKKVTDDTPQKVEIVSIIERQGSTYTYKNASLNREYPTTEIIYRPSYPFSTFRLPPDTPSMNVLNGDSYFNNWELIQDVNDKDNPLAKYNKHTFLVMYDDESKLNLNKFDNLKDAVGEAEKKVENNEITYAVIYKACKLLNRPVKVTDL